MPRCEPSAAWGRLQLCGLVGSALLGGWHTATLPPALTWGPCSPSLPSRPLSLSHSPLPPSLLTPSDPLTSHQSLPCSAPQFPHPRHGMKRNSHLPWLGEAGVRLEAEITKAPVNKGAGTAQVKPCLTSLKFFTPQMPTPPLLGSLSCCANLDPCL